MNNIKKYGSEKWKKEYKRYVDSDDLIKAYEFLLETIPEDKMVYKYYRGINRDYETISTPKLWLSNAFYLNDPFDCSFSLKVELDKSSKATISESVQAQMRQDVKSINLQNRVLLASFSERNDSILMWSHYANEHRGICVGYSLKDILSHCTIFPVIYDDKLPQFDENAAVSPTVLTKYIDWSYEKEWRIINYNVERNIVSGKPIDFIPPKEIILGYKKDHMIFRENRDKSEKTNHELLEAPASFFIDYAQTLGIECIQYKIDAGSFGFEKIIRI